MVLRRPSRAPLVAALVGAAVLAAPLLAGAQRGAPARIGYLGNGTPKTNESSREAFIDGMRERGWIEGQTLAIEYRWAEGHAERLPALLADLLRAKVEVIVLAGSPATQAARAATRTVPVVFLQLADPVAAGFVQSLAHPGGNMTGVASEFESLIQKQLELLKEAVPTISRVALLHYTGTTGTIVRQAETAAVRLGLTATAVSVGSADRLDSALAAARRERADAIHVLPSPFFNASRRRLIELVARQRLPAMYEFKDYVDDGGLMSYGPNITAMFRGMASHVDRILKGARPADLPVERPTQFELAINLKTARALGLTVPPAVLARADAVIE